MDQIFTDEVEVLYDRFDCPVTVLWGQRDEWIPHEKCDVLANLISGQECIVIENAGHLVQEDCPEAIVAAVLNTISDSIRADDDFVVDRPQRVDFCLSPPFALGRI
ncbi:alpha/beta hydrolase [Pseudomonas sp. CDFA 602]|uniref:alpha/beta fold hydrolase n=1 Tax=Pseudomonas californiensis TaxID=2829823 RepID=UPI001E4302CF|nr:alpha/beta hydrolase [Pseudomonas californiensis]MCD5992457.1 alpha/beta hydrolase [Pseudomonas californiensis]MCD5998265.1 alpha/beta hydrolase [Pseudomonas californiensis]